LHLFSPPSATSVILILQRQGHTTNTLLVMNIFCSPTDVKVDDGAQSTLECDYDKDATTLYQAIESEAWIPVLQFLETGKWEHMFGADPNPPSRQAQTWVTRFDNDRVRWSILPIHLAIIKNAPSKITTTLLDLHPLGAKSVDDQGSLPLHLAFKHGASDRILIDLIQRFPESLFTKDSRGRIPVDIEGSQKERTALLRATIKATTTNIDSMQKASDEKKLSELWDNLTLLQNLNASLENDKNTLERRLSLLKMEFLKLRKENKLLLEQQEILSSGQFAMQQYCSSPLLGQESDPVEVPEIADDSQEMCSPYISTDSSKSITKKNSKQHDKHRAVDNRSPFQHGCEVERSGINDARVSHILESRSDKVSLQQLRDIESEDMASFAATLKKRPTGEKRRSRKSRSKVPPHELSDKDQVSVKQSSQSRMPLPPRESSGKDRVLAKQTTWTGEVRHIPDSHPGTKPRKTHGFFGGFSVSGE
jgi:hypothetical protein